MSLLDVRAAIVAGLSSALPTGTAVETHRGRFDSSAEIKRFATKAPAVLVACVRAPLKDPGSGLGMIPASWAVFVLTRDMPQIPRDAGALALVEAILLCISGNCWGRADVAEPVNLDARNLYSGTVDNLGVALWAITFEQTVTDLIVDETTLNAFVTFNQNTQLGPDGTEIVMNETDTLPQAAGTQS